MVVSGSQERSSSLEARMDLYTHRRGRSDSCPDGALGELRLRAARCTGSFGDPNATVVAEAGVRHVTSPGPWACRTSRGSA